MYWHIGDHSQWQPGFSSVLFTLLCAFLSVIKANIQSKVTSMNETSSNPAVPREATDTVPKWLCTHPPQAQNPAAATYSPSTCWLEDVWVWELIEVGSVINAFDLDGNGGRPPPVEEHKTRARRSASHAHRATISNINLEVFLAKVFLCVKCLKKMLLRRLRKAWWRPAALKMNFLVSSTA